MISGSRLIRNLHYPKIRNGELMIWMVGWELVDVRAYSEVIILTTDVTESSARLKLRWIFGIRIVRST